MSIYHGECQGYHDTIPEVRRCHGVGYGGEALPPARGYNNARRGSQLPATEPQMKFVRTLLEERDTSNLDALLSDELVERVSDVYSGKTIWKHEASPLIEALQKLPKKKSTEDARRDKVGAGRYALPGDDGVVRFYKVDRPTDGKWSGYVFVKGLIGSPGSWMEQKLPRAEQSRLLDALSKSPEEYARLFGRKFQICGHCSSPLSHPQSRAAGYGGECAGNHGYWYPTMKEALAILEEMGEEQQS